MPFGTNILSRYAKLTQVRNALVVDNDEDIRLFISTILASVWCDAEVDEFDPESDSRESLGDWHRYDLVLIKQRFSEGPQQSQTMNWLNQQRDDPDFPRTIIIANEENDEQATDRVRKGKGFSERLLKTICNLDYQPEARPPFTDPGEFFASTASLFDSHCDADDKGKTLGNSSAMYIIKLDQFPVIKARKGQFYADKLAESLHQASEQWMRADGANPARSMHSDAAIYIYTTGILGDIHAEMLAENICQRIRAGELQVDGQSLPGTVSIGVCTENENRQIDIIGFAALAENAQELAEEQGGDGFQVVSFSELQQEAPKNPVEQEPAPITVNVLALLKSKRLSIGFQRITDTNPDSTGVTLQPKPSILDEQGEPCTFARLSTLFSTPGNATQLDRIELIQAIKLLHKKDQHKHGTILLDLSTESVSSNHFWNWLEERLIKSQRGRQFIFNLNLDNFQARRVSTETIQRITASTGCQFAIRGLGDGLLPTQWALKLEQSWLVIDMEDDFASLSCDQISDNISEAHKHQIKVILRNVDSSDKLFCAYSSGADMLQGELADEWDAVELSPLDEPMASSSQQTWAQSA